MTFSNALHRFNWTISDFDMADPDVDLESLWFRAYYILDVEFRLVLTPRGDADPSAVSLFLQRKGSDVGPAKIKVKFEVGLVDAFGVDRNGKAVTGEFERNSKCGLEVFLPRSEVLDFLQRGAITIYCKVHAETFQYTVREDFDYKRGVEELVFEKLVENKTVRLESKLLSPGIDANFLFENDLLKILLVPLEVPKEDLEVFAQIETAGTHVTSSGKKITKDEMANLAIPAVKPSDLKKDDFKLKVTIMDMKPIVTTKKHEGKRRKSHPTFEYALEDLYLKAKDGGFQCTSFPLIAHSPRLYRAVSDDDWLYFGLIGRINDLPEVNQVKEGTVKITRKPGCTFVHLPDLSKSALETVYKYLNHEEENLQIVKETVEDIYQVGRVLEIPMIGDICVAEYWKKNMTTDSVLDILKFGSSLSDEDHRDILTNICLDHIHRYMKEILSSDDWRNFLTKDKDLAEIVLNHLKECEGQREII